MAGTIIHIHCEDLEVVCPYCDFPQREINIHRVWNPEIECDNCMEMFAFAIPEVE